MYSRLFERQEELDEPSLRKHARTLGLEAPRFNKCLAGEATERVRTDASIAGLFSIAGTPTFFFGLSQGDGRVKVFERFSGARPLAEFQRILDKLLQTSTGSGK
jgi:predicted DsbA family dithiol-disulfide isomerase